MTTHNHARLQTVREALFILGQAGTYEYITLPTHADSPISHNGECGSEISIRPDPIIGFEVIRSQSWEPEKSAFWAEAVKALTSSESSLVTIDIGANIGLFTRQCYASSLGKLNRSSAFYCYEPDEANFRILQKNLQGVPNLFAHQNAISDTNGLFRLYRDVANPGNYSLNSKSVPTGQAATIASEVKALSASEESLKWATGHPDIFFKSDTQGYDEQIICSLAQEFWKHCFAGVFEVRRIAGKSFDSGKMMKFLNHYPNKVTAKNQAITSDEIMRFIDGPPDMADIDILFWK